jgi:hypothetical protein
VRPLIVGEAPGPGTDPRRPLHPECDAGKRLCKIAGLSPEEYLAAFDRVNLLCASDGWSADAACEAAAGLLWKEARRVRLVLIGRRVAAAFGAVGLPYYQWSDAVPPGIPFIKMSVAVIPRNSPVNAELARKFWRGLAEEAKRP